MIMFYKSLLCVYMLILIMSLNFTTWWWLWMSFELLNWVLLLFLETNQALIFLIWQSLASIFFLYMLVLVKNWGMIQWILLIKMSVPPFHFMFYSFLLKMKMKGFMIFISIHKIIPTLFILNIFKMQWFVLLTNGLSFLSFFFSNSFKMMFFYLVSGDGAWILMLWSSHQMVYLIYFLYFSLLVYLVNDWHNQNKLLMVVMIMGFPPMIMFNLKWMILIHLNLTLSLALMMTILLNIVYFWSFWVIGLNFKLLKTISKNLTFLGVLNLLAFISTQ
uniref:NADH dehydrogenase subunit 2 n=1 Tax=Thaumamermis cosgrovei TaxID=382538 RepID=Q1HBE3_THACS|nr:NADH dehydrogenase subunit 2 [Thaumamermis cosgrovei]ABF48138.1 NADH dehydrogenase subunit 2 [Thaumamermis cosgrovei]ABF48150.1 NADH dehydrogenase subunit 2 [Thaumamermis cosgrovei]